MNRGNTSLTAAGTGSPCITVKPARLSLLNASRRGSGDHGSHGCQHPGSTSCSSARSPRSDRRSCLPPPPSAMCAPGERCTGTAGHADRRCRPRKPDPSTLCGLQSRHDGLVDVSSPMFRPPGTQAQRVRHLCRSGSSRICDIAASPL